MPICQIKTNFKMNIQKKEDFMKCVCLELSQILDKPVQAVMVMISDEYMYMNNSSETVLFAEFRYVKDFDSAEEKTAFLKDFADRMLEIFRRFTSVDPYRVYMQFTEMPRDGAWKYN